MRQDHATTRLRERTRLRPAVLRRIRRRLARLDLPPGTHHLPLSEGYAVIKDVGKQGAKKHVLATVLARDARHLPGQDLSYRFSGVKLAAFSDELRALLGVGALHF